MTAPLRRCSARVKKNDLSIPSDYEASLKKEGGIPDGPVLESLLAGETLDKKVETKEEEPMSECQVRPPRHRCHCSALSHLCCC